jgi:hypothetical protein
LTIKIIFFLNNSITKKIIKKNGVHLWVHTKTDPVFLIV